jgi:hypothetical protein
MFDSLARFKIFFIIPWAVLFWKQYGSKSVLLRTTGGNSCRVLQTKGENTVLDKRASFTCSVNSDFPTISVMAKP